MRSAAEAAHDEALARHRETTDALLARLRDERDEREATLRAAAAPEGAAIAAWAEAEIARIRSEAEERLAERDGRLERALAEAETAIAARTATVARISEGYREELETFHARLMATEDPARFAELAAAVPEAPTFAGLDAPAMPAAAAVAMPTAAGVRDVPEATEDAAAPADPDDGRQAALTAAEAEVAARLGVAHQPHAAPAADAETGGIPAVGTTRIVVTGLVSLSGVATFKQQLARRPGVQSLSVSSSADGAFVFTVVHRTSLALLPIVAGLETFAPRITAGAGDELHVAAVDPEAA